MDTAGIRATKDEIESIGVERAIQTIQQAELVIFIFDVSTTSYTNFEEELKDIQAQNSKAPTIILANKYDLISKNQISIDDRFSKYKNLHLISAHQDTDVHDLKKEMLTCINNLNSAESNHVVSNARHYEALQQAHQDVAKVLQAFEMQVSSELIAHDMRQAINSIGSITGEVDIDQDILGTIFGKFCIGK
jgi:tRNA modification GTPase